MARKISTDAAGKPYANILLQGEIVERCIAAREKIGIPITSIVRMAVLDWLARHDGETGIRKARIHG
ncbi:MAG: hypothetical protein WC488_02895 [Candidatus Micrarchaeia archaeon]